MKNFLARALQVSAATSLIINVVPSSLGAPTQDEPAVAAVNALGIDLLHAACKPDANALLSPYSIQSAFAMACAGADGATLKEMQRVLHYPTDEAALHPAFIALRKELEKAAQASRELAGHMPREYASDPLVLAVANRLFGQSGYNFQQPFLSLLKDGYAAPFEAVDFKQEPARVARRINDWVESQTEQRLSHLIPDDALNRLTRLVVVNAIYLKAPWTEPFETAATESRPFYVNGSQPVSLPTMQQKREFSFVQGNGFAAVSLPLSYMFRFMIFLPAERDGLARLERQLSSEMVAGKMKWEARDVTLSIPRFKLEPPAFSLKGAFQRLGLKTAFDIPRRSANFDRIAPRRPDDYLAISDIFHKTFLNVGEKGIEAAAATAMISITAGIHDPPKPVEVKVDHPFLFAIVSDVSDAPGGGVCLFLGHVTDPR